MKGEGQGGQILCSLKPINVQEDESAPTHSALIHDWALILGIGEEVPLSALLP